jgi:hypothetical protein
MSFWSPRAFQVLSFKHCKRRQGFQMPKNDKEDNEMLELIQDVERIASNIADRQEQVTRLSKVLRVRRMENHFTAEIANLFRGTE